VVEFREGPIERGSTPRPAAEPGADSGCALSVPGPVGHALSVAGFWPNQYPRRVGMPGEQGLWSGHALRSSLKSGHRRKSYAEALVRWWIPAWTMALAAPPKVEADTKASPFRVVLTPDNAGGRSRGLKRTGAVFLGKDLDASLAQALRGPRGA